jgi:hypothetical protein
LSTRLIGTTALVLVLESVFTTRIALSAPVSEDLWYLSTISSGITGPISLRAELNYDDARSDAPIAVVMHGYSGSSGTLSNVRAQAQRLRDAGFFAVSVAMRGRDGSAGIRDSGGLEIHDIYDAVEAVKVQYAPHVDPTNVHITGYSGGGGNVMSAIVRYPDSFRVGSSFFGMADYGFDAIEGWYNLGAGGRTAQLDQDIGNPNLGNALVLDRYWARASMLAAHNSRHIEVHLFVDDDETICPPVNHARFAQIGGSHVTSHVGNPASPAYVDFNGNQVEDPGERQLWPHGFPNANQQAAGEQWYLDRLLAGQIPEPQIDPAGTFVVPGYLVTKHFEVWLGNGQNAAGITSYAFDDSSAQFSTEVVTSNASLPLALVVKTGFLSPPGAPVFARLNGEWIETFPAGERRVFFDLSSDDVIELELAPAVVGLPGAAWAIVALAGAVARIGYRRLR